MEYKGSVGVYLLKFIYTEDWFCERLSLRAALTLRTEVTLENSAFLDFVQRFENYEPHLIFHR